MGTQSSNNSKDENIMNDKTEDPSIQWNEISSYKGMKSDTSSTKNNKNIKKKLNQEESSSSNSSLNETKTKEETTISKKDERIPFKFEWKEGGNKVTITGSFLSNWTVFIEMVKNPENGNFEFNINLPKSIHQFKFIVDNIWKCSNNYPILNDGSGNFNNVIDLTNFVIKDEENNSNQNDLEKEKEKDKKKKDKNKNKNDYNCYIPNKNEMNIDAPFIPPHYINFYDIDYNTKQNVIGKKKYLHFVEKDILSENSCYKSILRCPHVNLNHCFNCCKIGNDDKYIRSSTSQRYKHKLMTIIYYKPKKKNEILE